MSNLITSGCDVRSSGVSFSLFFSFGLIFVSCRIIFTISIGQASEERRNFRLSSVKIMDNKYYCVHITVNKNPDTENHSISLFATPTQGKK